MRRVCSKVYMRLMAVLCVLLLLCAVVPTAAVSAAPAMDWYIYNGMLVVEGGGAIPDYTEESPAPWYDQRDSILHVSIGDGITAIGSMAFYECGAMVSVTLPAAVTRIGDKAFAGCGSLTTVRMPQVKTIGDAAFSRCGKLRDVILPTTLTSIGDKAFYVCESLTYISVPSSVTYVGGEAFAYCSALLQADVKADLTALPEWCFYGCEQLVAIRLPATIKTAGDSAFTRCDNLDVVYYTGTDADRETLVQSIADSLPGFTTAQISSTNTMPSSTENKVTVSGEEDDTYQEVTTTVSQKGDTLFNVEQTVTYPAVGSGDAQRFDATIHATLQSESGWNALMDEMRQQGNHKTTFEISHGEQEPTRVVVVLNEDMTLPGSWLKDLVGRDVIVTINTPNGSRLSINGNHIGGYEFEDSYDLSYTLSPCLNLSESHRQTVGSSVCYWLTFRSAFTFPVTVEVFLDPYAANQYATLYEQIPDGSLGAHNSALIDEEGYVGFPWSVLNKSTRYLLAINVPTVHRDEVLMPDSMVDDPGTLEDVVPLNQKYTFSEPRGFKGMTMKEFTQFIIKIVAAFLGVVLAVVLFFIIRSKRKMKMAAIRAEVMGTDATEEYDASPDKKRARKRWLRKAELTTEAPDEEKEK